jgi:hypothetical protein
MFDRSGVTDTERVSIIGDPHTTDIPVEANIESNDSR